MEEQNICDEPQTQFLMGYLKATIDIITKKAETAAQRSKCRSTEKRMEQLIARNSLLFHDLRNLEARCGKVKDEMKEIIDEIKRVSQMLELIDRLPTPDAEKYSEQSSSDSEEERSEKDESSEEDENSEGEDECEEDENSERSEKDEDLEEDENSVGLEKEEYIDEMNIIENSDTEDSLFGSGCEIKCKSFFKWWK